MFLCFTFCSGLLLYGSFFIDLLDLPTEILIVVSGSVESKDRVESKAVRLN